MARKPKNISEEVEAKAAVEEAASTPIAADVSQSVNGINAQVKQHFTSLQVIWYAFNRPFKVKG